MQYPIAQRPSLLVLYSYADSVPGRAHSVLAARCQRMEAARSVVDYDRRGAGQLGF
jgi:hypothetical protein